MERLTGIPPAAEENSKILILGSMPGAQSLAEGRYYANPRNDFWRLIFAALEEADPGTYDARLEILKNRGVALWDSIASCERHGSLDAHIRNLAPNDIPAFLAAHPGIRAVCFNGAASCAAHDRHFSRQEGVAYLRLPSSSPVPRRDIRGFADKLPYWLELRAYL